MLITEPWILSHAPSPAVAEDGRALSEAGSFETLRRTEDGKTYWAECVGSAQNPYSVSIDFSLSEKEPIYGCSCPSRHFPCKHAVGLMYEIMAGKPFSTGKAPAYVTKARSREAAERAKAEARLLRARKYGAAVKGKKLERQFEGLAKAEKLINTLLADGVVNVSGLPPQSLDRLAAELGNCGLSGARDAMEHVSLLERQLRQDGMHARQYYAEMLRYFAEVQVMIRRCRSFLSELQSSGSYALEDPVLYELLGGEWNLDELREIGSCRKNAMLVQLSFDISCDEATRTCSERGFWLDLSRGDLVHTRNTYPVKAAKSSVSGDSCLDLMEVSVLYETPVTPCPQVCWDNGVAIPLTEEDREALLGFADACLADTVDAAREYLSEPLLPDVFPAFVTVGAVGYVDGTLVLEDREGNRISLRDRCADDAEHASVRRLISLPEPPVEGDALFGLMFYDEATHQICLHPYSLVRASDTVRLQY